MTETLGTSFGTFDAVTTPHHFTFRASSFDFRLVVLSPLPINDLRERVRGLAAAATKTLRSSPQRNAARAC